MPLPRRGGVARVPEQMAGSSKVIFVETAPAAPWRLPRSSLPLELYEQKRAAPRNAPRGMALTAHEVGARMGGCRQDSRFDGAGFRVGRPLGGGTASAGECAMSPQAAGSRRAGCVQCEPTSLGRSLGPGLLSSRHCPA